LVSSLRSPETDVCPSPRCSVVPLCLPLSTECSVNRIVHPLAPRTPRVQCPLVAQLALCSVALSLALPSNEHMRVQCGEHSDSLHSRLCTLGSAFAHSLYLALCFHRAFCSLLSTLYPCTLCTVYSRLCTLTSHFRLCILALPALSSLHSASALSDCAVIVHSAPSSRLCALVFSVLSTLHYRTPCTLDSVLSHSLCTLDPLLSTLASVFCTLALCSRRALWSLLLTLCPRTFCTVDSAFPHSLHSRHSRLCTLAL